MRRRLPFYIALAALAALPVFAAAQTAMPSHTLPLTGTFLSVQASNQWLASRMIGMPVFDRDDGKIGTIIDLVVGLDGAVQAIVIGTGGFLGIGERHVAVTLRETTIQRGRKGDRATVKLSKAEIGLAPNFQHFSSDAGEAPAAEKTQ